MRKREKEKILSLLGSMVEAHQAIQAFLQEEKGEEAISLLSLCQEAMEKCGKEVEMKEEQGEIYSSLFFTYLEDLFHCYESIQEKNWTKAKELFTKALFSYQEILSAVQSLKEQIMMLFLPYKLSMWDSMESVYLAAKNDPSCIPLIMPITYFQRNNQLEMQEGINEAKDFPQNLDVISEDFSIEEQRPDCIFIHNPYDENNYVTSVHERYYSSRLKVYTDCLVYIPYFSSMGVLTNDPIFLPAYEHVHYIVAQNEVHKGSFPKEVREKCVLLGSPKFDRALKQEQRHGDFLQEWKDFAGERKVIFYNTSISLMLENTEAFLEKMEEVFEVFSQHKEYCLLWRPHPLLENSFKTIRAGFSPWYLRLKERFIKDKIGILDEQSDIEDAISFSDMYLGDDGSSMGSLFATAKKPLFILDNRLLHKERDPEHKIISELMEALDGESAAIYEGRFLLKGRREGEIFHIEKEALQEYLLEEISGDAYKKAFYFAKGKNKEEQWVLPPYSENKILSLTKGQSPKSSSLKSVAYRPDGFSEWRRYGDKLLGKPAFYENIVSYSQSKGLVSEGDNFSVFLRSFEDGKIYRGGMLHFSPFLLFPIHSEKTILFVEEKSFEKTIFSLQGEEKSGFSDLILAKEERCLWALPIEGTTLYKISLAKGTWQKYELNTSTIEELPHELQESARKETNAPLGYDAFHGGETRKYLHSSLYEPKAKLWIAPQNGETVLCMDKKSAKVKKIYLEKEVPEADGIDAEKLQFAEKKVEEERMWKKRYGGRFISFRGEDYYYDNRKNRLYLMKEDEIHPLKIQLDFAVEELLSGFLPWERSLYSIREGDLYTLKDYLEGKALAFPFSKDKLKKRLDTVSYNMDGTAGEKIYQFFAKECRKEKE